MSARSLQTRQPFHADAIDRPCFDSREDSHNRDRIAAEPTYARFAADVAHSTVELEARLAASTRFLENHIPATDGLTILDFAGIGTANSCRVSIARNLSLKSRTWSRCRASTRRFTQLAELGAYSIVHLANVVEHVVDPLILVTYVASQGRSQAAISRSKRLRNSPKPSCAALRQGSREHGHPRAYQLRCCKSAISKLVESAGRRLVAIDGDAGR